MSEGGIMCPLTPLHLGGASPTLDGGADTLSADSSSLADTRLSVDFSSFFSHLLAVRTMVFLTLQSK